MNFSGPNVVLDSSEKQERVWVKFDGKRGMAGDEILSDNLPWSESFNGFQVQILFVIKLLLDFLVRSVNRYPSG